jgi:O-antigen ligase/Flp pilus assembly protein TadD
MRNHISVYLDNAITFLLLLVAGATPLLFLNQTTEFFDMPKLIFLIVSTLLLFGLWIASWIFKGKVSFTRTPLDIPLLFLLGIVLISTYFSVTKTAAIYGNFPTVHGSAVAWVTYILLYFVTVSHLKTVGRIKTFLTVLYGSAVVVSLITFFSFFNIYLPFDFARAANFTPTGSSFSTIAFLLLLLPLPLFSLLNPNKHFAFPVALGLSILFSVTIVLIGAIPTYIVLGLIYVLCIFVSKPHQVRRTLPMFFIPVIVTAATLFLAYTPMPAPLNAFYQQERNFPKEIQLPFNISWKVTASTFRDAPFIGTGPATYLFNFSSYKPAEFNQTRFWNFSFDSAYNEFLQILGTLGILGFSAVVFLSMIILRTAWKNLSTEATEGDENRPVFLPALAISSIISIVLLGIHAATLVSLVLTLFIFAALMMSQRAIRERVVEFALGIKATTSDNKQFDLFPVLIFIVFLVGTVPALYKLVNVVAADYYHRQALAQANKSGTLTYQYLQKAESLNPEIDLYRVDMAQTNFALANAIAAQKGPTADNPQGSLTDQDRQTIQTLISQAVNEGRAAVALSPRSPRNWEVLASIYRNISGVADNALAFSLDAYGRAIQRDPLNPALRLNVGGIYYTAKNYDLAIRFFTDAINLKPDYVNAYYNLAIALRDKGDLQNAQQVAQQAVVLLQDNKESNDYKTVTALLEEIKKKAATGASQTSQSATVGQTDSALSKDNLEDVTVSNLNNPPSVTPVPAVKSNPNAKVPQASITPSAAPTKPANQ